MASPRDAAKRDSRRRIAELSNSMLKGMDQGPASHAMREARSLLDYAEEIIAPDLPEAEDLYARLAISRTIPFIAEAAYPAQKHLRLMASAHILTNILRSEIESTDEEYATAQFEELESDLANLEGVDITNPSIDNRLLAIFEGLMELASAFGLTDVDDLDIRR